MVVVMNADVYDRWHVALALLKILVQSQGDIEAGRTVSTDEAFARAMAAIDEAKKP